MSTGAREGYSSEDERELNEIKSELVSSAESVENQLLGHFLSVPSSPSLLRLRPDTDFTLLSVRDRISSIENLAASSTPHSTMSGKEKLKEELKPKRASRGSYRGKITRQLNLLKEKEVAGTLNKMLLEREVKKITAYLDKIEELEGEMSDIWDRHKIALDDADRAQSADASDAYFLDVTTQLTNLEQELVPKPVDMHNDVSNKDLVEAIAKSQ